MVRGQRGAEAERCAEESDSGPAAAAGHAAEAGEASGEPDGGAGEDCEDEREHE